MRRNYKMFESIMVDGVEYMIDFNLKCDKDELMLVEIGTN